MQPRTPGLLWDILDAARFVLAEYERNRLLRSAVERQFEILGEAARRLAAHDAPTASVLPDLPRIIAFRNLLAHGYDRIDNAQVWEVIERSLPTLILEVERLLVHDDSGTEP